jgi:hypothetical protein
VTGGTTVSGPSGGVTVSGGETVGSAGGVGESSGETDSGGGSADAGCDFESPQTCHVCQQTLYCPHGGLSGTTGGPLRLPECSFQPGGECGEPGQPKGPCFKCSGGQVVVWSCSSIPMQWLPENTNIPCPMN